MKKVFWGNSRFSMWSALFMCFFCPQYARGDGQTKFINLANEGVTPIDIHTSRGSFLMDGLQQLNAALIFSRDHWKDLTGQRPTWFAATQKGNKLVGTGAETTDAQQGLAVALSADGNMLVSGAPLEHNGAAVNSGAVWTFIRTGGVFSQSGNKLTQVTPTAATQFGNAVSLSCDGGTLAVGAHYYDAASNIGTVYIYTRTGATWGSEQKLPDPSGRTGDAGVGESVKLSCDGDTLAVSGSADNANAGAVWVFTRIGGVWTQQSGKITVPADGVGATLFGHYISLSADGNTLAIGSLNDNGSRGAVWIFIRINNAWVQQGNKLVPNDLGGATNDYAGVSALSADGNTLAIGGNGDNGSKGAAWIFRRSNGVWSQQASKLVGTGNVGNAGQGISVSLSSDGNTLAVGGFSDDASKGAVWLWIQRNGLWTQAGKKLVGTGAVNTPNPAFQGYSVALSSDGNTLAEGGYQDNTFAGAVWVFA